MAKGAKAKPQTCEVSPMGAIVLRWRWSQWKSRLCEPFRNNWTLGYTEALSGDASTVVPRQEPTTAVRDLLEAAIRVDGRTHRRHRQTEIQSQRRRAPGQSHRCPGLTRFTGLKVVAWRSAGLSMAGKNGLAAGDDGPQRPIGIACDCGRLTGSRPGPAQRPPEISR